MHRAAAISKENSVGH